MGQGRVAGRTAIVTGGSRGIGKATAVRLAEEGANVAIFDVVPEGEFVAEAIRATGARAIFVTVDLTREERVREAVNDTARTFGAVDILVNNAGTNIRKPPQDYSLDEWKTILDTNLTSAFVCSQAAYPALVKAGGGKIINTGSMTSIFGAGFAAPYSASKGAIVQLSKALASAWAKDNIQVNAILPGWIDTELTRQARQDLPGLHDRVLARTPAARWGDPDDFAGIAIFLASRASDFVTGAAIPVDGGYSSQA